MSVFSRFDGNDLLFYVGLALLFAGLWLVWSLGAALVVVGGILAGVGFLGALRKSEPPVRGQRAPERTSPLGGRKVS